MPSITIQHCFTLPSGEEWEAQIHCDVDPPDREVGMGPVLANAVLESPLPEGYDETEVNYWIARDYDVLQDKACDALAEEQAFGYEESDDD
jgi:hypothetical protein